MNGIVCYHEPDTHVPYCGAIDEQKGTAYKSCWIAGLAVPRYGCVIETGNRRVDGSCN
jgi:hypothetical protein